MSYKLCSSRLVMIDTGTKHRYCIEGGDQQLDVDAMNLISS